MAVVYAAWLFFGVIAVYYGKQYYQALGMSRVGQFLWYWALGVGLDFGIEWLPVAWALGREALLGLAQPGLRSDEAWLEAWADFGSAQAALLGRGHVPRGVRLQAYNSHLNRVEF